MSEGVREFWYGSAERWSARILPRVMLSYNAIRRLRTPWELTAPVMMDSGAFQVILLYGHYPWGPGDYARAVEMWVPEVAWTMDFPCEPGVRTKGGYTVEQAQIKTNDNTQALRDLGVDIQSVVQGWDVPEYLANLDLLRSDGLLTPRLGIGSICRRGRTRDIVRVVRAVRANVPGWVKLHGFGVKTDVLRSEARFFLHSVDSSSWRIRAFGALGHRVVGPHHRGSIATRTPIVREYVEKMEAMLNPVEPLPTGGS